MAVWMLSKAFREIIQNLALADKEKTEDKKEKRVYLKFCGWLAESYLNPDQTHFPLFPNNF